MDYSSIHSADCRQSDGVVDAVRSLVLWIGMVTITLAIGMLAMMVALVRAENLMHRICILWGRTIALLSGARLRIEGADRIYRGDSTLILSNHQSICDIIFFYAVFNKQFRWMAKSSLFRIPIFGWAMAGAGYIPVERGDRSRARESLFRAANQVRRGKSVIIFPEGTIGKADGSMIPFKKGAFLLAKKADAVIQPVTIWGANQMVPDQKDRWMQRVYPCEIVFYIHEPIHPEQYAHLTQDELSAHVRRIINGPLLKHHLAVTETIGEEAATSWA
ncbi:MAG: 1-acyl-sn-glycerol-3-phosphate acyltransferase [Leptospiraceae bacterium]|nr:1-acyl-sn-glycerol-3-phosphate acyltransferase [Leptospiraceae bacterium]